jgi:hypothetical protein
LKHRLLLLLLLLLPLTLLLLLLLPLTLLLLPPLLLLTLLLLLLPLPSNSGFSAMKKPAFGLAFFIYGKGSCNLPPFKSRPLFRDTDPLPAAIQGPA